VLDVAEVGGRDGIPAVKASTRGPEPITAWTLESSFGIGNYRGRVMFEDRLEVHRVELTGYCYRMLACGAEAEDAVQETLFRPGRMLIGSTRAKRVCAPGCTGSLPTSAST